MSICPDCNRWVHACGACANGKGGVKAHAEMHAAACLARGWRDQKESILKRDAEIQAIKDEPKDKDKADEQVVPSSLCMGESE